jgi:two-component system, NarL family, sensor kinase
VNKDLIATVKELELKYETDKKEARIATLSHEKELQSYVLLEQSRLNAGLVGVVIVLIVSGALLYRNYIQRQQLQQQTILTLQTERQLVATNAVLQGQEGERKRLAKDLHDGLGGMLSGAKFTFDAMRDNLVMTDDNQKAFCRGMDLLETSIDELRRVAHNMMPESLVKTGLSQAVRDMCDDFMREDLVIIYQEYGLDNTELSNTVSITVYRIIQELVNNSMKHSGARQIIVQLSLHDDLLQVTVEDDGIGTTLEALDQSKGMGWANIRSRVDYLGGTVDVQGLDRKGTSITVTLSARQASG